MTTVNNPGSDSQQHVDHRQEYEYPVVKILRGSRRQLEPGISTSNQLSASNAFPMGTSVCGRSFNELSC